MFKLNLLVAFIVLFNVNLSYSYVDLNISYTHSKRRIEGTETSTNSEPGAAEITSQGFTINWAWYIWAFTALELNYGKNEELLDDTRKAVDDDITILQVNSKVTTEIAGVGLRQSFAGRKATIQPSLSIGYAQYTTTGTTSYVVEDGGVEKAFDIEQDANVFSSGYISAALRFRLTELMGFTLSAKTVMPEFDTSEAENNVTYSAGFSWIF